jgi:hypothetical protein
LEEITARAGRKTFSISFSIEEFTLSSFAFKKKIKMAMGTKPRVLKVAVTRTGEGEGRRGKKREEEGIRGKKREEEGRRGKKREGRKKFVIEEFTLSSLAEKIN